MKTDTERPTLLWGKGKKDGKSRLVAMSHRGEHSAKVSGAWVFKDTRMPVSIVFENLQSGATIEEIMDWFHVTREQIGSVLEFASRSLDAPPSRSSGRT